MLTDMYRNIGINWTTKYISGLNSNAGLSYLYDADNNKFLAASISCNSPHSDYHYELDAANWGKALTEVFKANSITDIEPIKKVFSELKFPFDIENIFKEHNVEYHKCAFYDVDD